MSSFNKGSEILDTLQSVVYVSDMDSYDLLYLNRYGRRLLGVEERDGCYGKCYKVLQGRSAPCEFCNNAELRDKKYCIWKRHYAALGSYFMIHDTILPDEERNLRVEIATDITTMEADALQTRDYLNTERNLVSCIQKLTKTENLQGAIDGVMASILDYYQGDRAYIFELDWDSMLAHNTYEQCAAGVTPEIDNLRNVPLDYLTAWVNMFGSQKYVYIDDLESIKDDPARRDEYEALAPQGIRRLLCTPFYEDGKLQGFLGVDNPVLHCRDAQFLLTLTYFISNETEKQRMNDRLERMSYYDYLTGVHNRNSYNEHIAVLEKKRPAEMGVIFSDMNGLKYINDTIGHTYGDKAILQMTQILRQHFSAGNIYRISGDEFVILCEGWSRERFDKAVDDLLCGVRYKDEPLAAIGTVWDDGSLEMNQMINTAEQTMYVNKQSYYATHPENRSKHRPAILDTLLKDMELGHYCVYLQPKSIITTGQVFGAEALIRKIGEDGRIIPPFEFIGLLEKERVISKIDFFVLEEVCRKLVEWQKAGLPCMKISVNVSRMTLAESDFNSHVVEICDRYGVAHDRIELEITESAETIDPRRMKEIIAQLNAEGFSISLDDMGVDYSTIRMIPMEGIDVVKLDRSFILTMNEGEKDRVLVEQIIKLCHALGRTCVAEGVDSNEQLALLRAMGCDYLQGYLLDRPIPIAEFEKKYLLAK